MKKDSSGIKVKSKILIAKDGRYFLLYDQKGKEKDDTIYADETIKISYQDQRNQRIIEGLATGNHWLFTIVAGRISLYSCYPPPDYISNECLISFRVDDGPVETVTIDNLIKAMDGNKKALAILVKENNWKNNYIKAVEKFNKDYP